MWIPIKRIALTLVLSPLLPMLAHPGVVRAQEAAPVPADTAQEPAPEPAEPAQDGEPAEEPGKLPSPPPDVPPQLLPMLPTIPWRQDKQAYGYTTISTAPLPKDREGIWVLDIAFKPLRIQTVEIPGKGRRAVHYLYYKIVNRTGSPRTFAPQFIMVNEQGQRFEDAVVREAIPVIQGREDPTIAVRGAVNIMGVIPPSTKQGVDDAVFGVAVWDQWDNKADRFSIYVRGLSDGYKEIPNPAGGKPIVKYKTLRLDFIRRGDERNISEKEIEPGDPPYDWVYW